MSQKRIILVEDEPLGALYVEDALIDAGYDVVGPAYSLDAALDLAITESLDAACSVSISQKSLSDRSPKSYSNEKSPSCC